MRISIGTDSKIENAFVIFQNKETSYPIIGVSDNIECIRYRSNPAGWMNSSMSATYVQDNHVIAPLPEGKIRRLYVDSCRVHNLRDQIFYSLQDLDSELHNFITNYTAVVQPLDQHIFHEFKWTWTEKCDRENHDCLRKINLLLSGVVSIQESISCFTCCARS